MTQTSPYTSRDPVPLGDFVVKALWVFLAANIVFGLGAAADVLRLVPEKSADLVGLATGGPRMIAFWVVGFFVLKWCYRVQMNAHTLAMGLSTSPVMQVAYFFIPIATWFMPYFGLRQAWQASLSPAAWANVKAPGILLLWWILWVVSSLMGAVTFQISVRMNPDPDLMRVLVGIDAVTAVIDIAVTLLLQQVVRRFSSDQQQALHNTAFA